MATMAVRAPTGGAVAATPQRRTLLMVLCAIAVVAVSVDAGVEAALAATSCCSSFPSEGSSASAWWRLAS